MPISYFPNSVPWLFPDHEGTYTLAAKGRTPRDFKHHTEGTVMTFLLNLRTSHLFFLCYKFFQVSTLYPRANNNNNNKSNTFSSPSFWGLLISVPGLRSRSEVRT